MSGERRLRKRRFGIVPAMALAALCVAAVDFILFANRVASATHEEDARADGIVALTGGSGIRIAAGVELVAEDRAQRLLISGVNPDVTRQELINLAGGSEEVWACCVDIGYMAESTKGNAEETAAWAYERDYERLIIVTSDYHMPRSLIVLQKTMPDMELIPWPVRTVNDPSSIWSDPDSFRGVLTEWLKWRVTTLE
ncbi:MAG: YdcF family protein [Alphaproteobacteria bacterium]|nr:YdcF family protein [Alphaproteobacteria bacterium]